MSIAHDEINRSLGLTLQIELLKQSLAENVVSWEACGLPPNSNVVAASIRQDIEVKQLQLAMEEGVR